MADISEVGGEFDPRLGSQQAPLKVKNRIPVDSSATLNKAQAAITSAAPAVSAMREPQIATVQGKNPDDVITELQSHEGWNENVLNGFQNATYHIRLFMVDDTPFEFRNYGTYRELVDYFTKTKKRTVVAESGVTGINIQNLTITTKAAPNSATRSMTATELVMNVVEPGGISFMDLLAQSARELRVLNYNKTMFLMEIRFLGYNGEDDPEIATGSFNENICQTFPNGGIWLYHLFLKDIETEVSANGGAYRLTFYPFEEQIQQDIDLRLPGHLSPEGNTVKEMVDDLLNKLNEHIKSTYGYNLRTYVASILPFDNGKTYDPGQFSLQPVKPQNNDKRALTLESVNGKLKAHFPHGTALNDAIEMIFANSPVVQQLAKDVMEVSKVELDGNKMRESVIFRSSVIAEVVEYDYTTEMYILKYNIVIRPYMTQRPILSRDQVELSTRPDVQAANARKLRSQGYLAKRYDYLFTGLNTEVINFDIKHNAAWSALLPRALGAVMSLEANVAHDFKLKETVNLFQARLAEIRSRFDEIEGLRSDRQRLLSEDSQKNQARIREIEAKLSTFHDEEERGLNLERTYLQDQVREGRSRIQANQSERQTPLPQNRAGQRFAEEILAEDEDEKYRYAPMPLSVVQNPNDPRFFASGSLPDHFTQDRALFGAVMDQLYETTGSALQNINLEIRGDPYWLGASNLERSLAQIHQAESAIPVRLNDDPNIDASRPDYTKGDVMFLLTYRYPRGVTEGGAPNIRFNDFFTGVYFVVTVTHKFDGGSFTQTLNAKRMPIIEAFRAFGLRSEEELKQIAENKSKGGSTTS